jgi:hypothetical protein
MKQQDMKTFWVVETQFQTSALYWIKWTDSQPGRFAPAERTHGTHWIGGWVAHSQSGHCGKKETFAPTGKRTPAVSYNQSLYWLIYSDSRYVAYTTEKRLHITK